MTSEKLAEFRAKGMLLDPKFDRLAVIGDKKKEKLFNFDKNKYIIGYMWCDKDGNSLKNGCVTFNQKNIFSTFNFTENALKKNCDITIYSSDTNEEIIKKTIKITKIDELIELDLNKLFQKSNLLVNNFKIKVTVDKEKYSSTSNSEIIKNWEVLKIHYVIFIPEIMNKLKWYNAEKVQKEWFNNNGNNYPWESEPRLNFYDFNWALEFDRFKKHFNKNFDTWKSEKSINSLKVEIHKMIKEKYVIKPNSTNTETTFGIFENDNKLVDIIIKPEELNYKETKCMVPLFDKFYFSSLKPFEESKLNAELDDLYGAIANTNIRIIASGFLKFENKKIFVYLKKIGFYIRDGFDFVGDQSLGNWHKNGVSTNIFKNLSINNESYRNYRKDTGKGQDFYVYSTVKYFNVNNFKFEL